MARVYAKGLAGWTPEKQCTAKAKITGERCKRIACTGRKTCQVHGGTQPVGIANANYKHGMRSKYMPARLFESYDAARANREYLNLTDDIALADARISDALTKVDPGESGELWASLLDCVQTLRKGDSRPTTTWHDEREVVIETICTLAQEGAADYAAWREVRTWMDHKRKTVETEQKRLVSMQQMMTADQAHNLMGHLISIIQSNVHDQESLTAIAREFGKLSLGVRRGAADPD